MDCQVLIYWERTTGLVYEGSITTVREAKAGVWDGSEYVIAGGMANPNHILIFVTGVPITSYLSLAYALERWSESEGGEPLEWHVKTDVVTPEEQAKILADRYMTVTWARFKELLADAADVSFTDDDLKLEHET